MAIDRTYITDLRFDRADFSDLKREEHCAWCTRTLEESYFEVLDRRICDVCADRARKALPEDTRAVFWRSTGFGALAAAMLGMAYFALFRATSGGWMVFASIGVGYLIARAMRVGSHGIGGRRYQWMAMGLTYVAVAIASSVAAFGLRDVPIWFVPLFVLTPIASLFRNVSFGALQLLLVGVGMRWAWGMMAGAPPKVTGPHRRPE
ncbi:hypothetical protein SAMN05421771_0624 [Granulicella pectinivorans]|uniref:Uncharacterized protein n=1 Tax=Granulicella pectinivorans TaxID=474950 RepID=A0A1I6LEI2_9BACT|nr:hypothetical protein [Granulicella pectinivorans]SFS01865.1 hypothetical protein SAMN05421771_0624 [Granulicella pectinivorans]